ncbi:transcriptional regulatory protein AlgP-like [Melitaea cinxia]|uniref:transcriptional regulatory protein AlgP-like n=1 Tax=Melitaea cinxia TaxID=113334 RepID=UPI001E26EE56|nr:transcriptional regulatory protein AlgP-like [Melitaea cinxia]
MDVSIKGSSQGCTEAKKRSSSSVFFVGSDTETEETEVSKTITARRGRPLGSKAGSSSRAKFLKSAPATVFDDLEAVLRGRQYRPGSATEGTTPISSGNESDYLAALDTSALNAQELRARAGEGLACIIEVAKKSGNLKGEFVARLKRSAKTLTEVVDALSSRSEAEESRRLRTENRRLKLEVEALKVEVKAWRRGVTEARTDAVAATTAAATATDAGARTPSTPLLGLELVEEIRSLTCSLGDRLNTRLAGIEARLLPAQTSCPTPRAKVVASTPPKTSPAPRGPETTATPSVAPSTAAQEETWATVVRKGKGKGKGKSSTPAPAPATKSAAKPTTASSAKQAAKSTAKTSAKSTAMPSGKPAAKATAKPKLKTPKTAAVVL